MLEIEIDGQKIEVPEGSTVMDAAHQVGTFIPHFCYHKKLSIAANCRMCLVQVEKAPKPLPACATPVTNGMVVFTHSEVAVKAQKGVMEFLLINHPLDCPICDQGGECQLQDLAVGYGSSASRYQEEKRVVVNKYLGPLVATDMTRCINCTRCVRFTQEIAGVMELGQAFRGEMAEIMPFIEKTVDSELSGNIIDLCPVGALTSKPFRYTARTWELSRRKSVSPHDGLGSNLIVQVKHNKVMRVLPLENEEINECWLSDKDRFSYEALNSEERLTKPMLKLRGAWQEVDWQTALEFVATELKRISKEHGPETIGALVSPHSTLEEMHLMQKFVRGVGSDNIDFRLRQSDFSLDGQNAVPWLGMKIADIPSLDSVLVIGSFLTKDHPLLAQRLRQAAKRYTKFNLLHVTDDDLYIKLNAKSIVAPATLVAELAGIVKAAAEIKSVSVSAGLSAWTQDVVPSDSAKKIAASLCSGEKRAVLLGNFAQQHPQASSLHLLAQELAHITGGSMGFLGEAANSVGGYVAKALPQTQLKTDGMTAAQMSADPLKAYLLLHAEPELDCANPQQVVLSMKRSDLVVALTPFKTRAIEFANVILPISPFTETSGTFINTEGRVQSFNAVVKPLDETRPAWKVIRVLGNLLGLEGFEQNSSEEVRQEVVKASVTDQPQFIEGLNNEAILSCVKPVDAPRGLIELNDLNKPEMSNGLQRIADVPIHFADPIARRAPALLKAHDSKLPAARMNAATLAAQGLVVGDKVFVRQTSGEITGRAALKAALDAGLQDNCVRVAAGHSLTADLGAMHGVVTLEKVLEPEPVAVGL